MTWIHILRVLLCVMSVQAVPMPRSRITRSATNAPHDSGLNTFIMRLPRQLDVHDSVRISGEVSGAFKINLFTEKIDVNNVAFQLELDENNKVTARTIFNKNVEEIPCHNYAYYNFVEETDNSKVSIMNYQIDVLHKDTLMLGGWGDIATVKLRHDLADVAHVEITGHFEKITKFEVSFGGQL